ncbi:LysM peptidoglycan-binding domain-containing protein [Desulfofundulus thermobenzoicus]|uniref:LysM peptidoglycan-binding domain-containing protein n=1 Tax=Desulfofundulus thermobenzoicus TaxID=29376 RepID=A0A6N7IU89_9FIRM|nr:cell wall hydrolase [Desulfofundulus thermobenzoicus]MQL53079.1 LysM peptidoglycan-binding domain-containing protein [Desulfofundulus thermobenzoicus]HHW43337.1 LysM peptidoglycan-binding domain-containing protein [Desulfotomaculum sp.]
MGSRLIKIAGLVTILLLLQGVVALQRGYAGEMIAGSPGGAELSDMRHLACYTVRPGDTLISIAQQFDLPVERIMAVNKLTGSTINPGDVLILPDRSYSSIPSVISRGAISREDLLLLARVIHAEARGESFTGQVAVGAVILNRVTSPGFPKTIREVVYQKNKHIYQFSPVADGSINLEPDETAINAAIQALMGCDPTNGALFFYNPRTAADRWIRTLPVVTRIGNHVFATKA